VRAIGELAAIRRDTIPLETIRLWFIEILKLGWSKAKLLEQVNKAKRIDKYGAIDFTHLLTGERLYTEQETELKLRERVRAIIRRGEQLLSQTNIEVVGEIQLTADDLETVRAALLYRISQYYVAEKDALIDNTIDDLLQQLRDSNSIKSKFAYKFNTKEDYNGKLTTSITAGITTDNYSRPQTTTNNLAKESNNQGSNN